MASQRRWQYALQLCQFEFTYSYGKCGFLYQEFCVCKFSLRFSQQKKKCWKSLYTISLTWLDECISDLNNCWIQFIGPIQMTAFLSAHIFARYCCTNIRSCIGLNPLQVHGSFRRFLLSRVGCNCRWGLDWWFDLLTIYTLDSELQAITALPLNSTIHKSPQHPLNLFSACCVFIGRSLATVSNSGDSSASRAQVLSSQPPVHNSTVSLNLATAAVYRVTA
jgi:hypothetical protein